MTSRATTVEEGEFYQRLHDHHPVVAESAVAADFDYLVISPMLVAGDNQALGLASGKPSQATFPRDISARHAPR